MPNHPKHTDPNPSTLKDLYNTNFLKAKDSWSYTNIHHTDAIINRILKYLRKKGFTIDKTKRSLDVGCAKGYFTESLRKKGFVSEGLDYSDIAIQIAEKNFPQCKFFIMDGFNPTLKNKYDLIFMKGFSGTNTHNLDFVAKICNKYIEGLHNEGWLILSFSTDFSGKEKMNETVNWTRKEIFDLASRIKNASLTDIKFFSFGFARKIFRRLLSLAGIKRKKEFYLFFRKTI